MNNEVEEIQSELGTLAERRDKIAADLASATEAATAATQAIADGASATAALIATGGAKTILQNAYAALVAKIKPLESKLDAAKEAAGQAERAENYEAALKAYDSATAEAARLVKEFATGNAAALQSLEAARSAVHGAENAMSRAGERPHYRASALEYSRPCGDVRPFLKHLEDYLQGKTYVTLSAPADPEHARDLSKAGID
jgi:chromosome segregation ATPase